MPPSEGCQSGLCPRRFLSSQPFCPRTINLGSQQFEDPHVGHLFPGFPLLAVASTVPTKNVFSAVVFCLIHLMYLFTFGVLSIRQCVAQSLAPLQKAKPNKPLLPPGPRCCATASPSPSASRGSVPYARDIHFANTGMAANPCRTETLDLMRVSVTYGGGLQHLVRTAVRKPYDSSPP